MQSYVRIISNRDGATVTAERLNQNLIPDNTKAVILDWDDTVMGTMRAKMRQHQFVASEHYGIELTDAYMQEDWGRPLHYLIEKWYGLEPGNVELYTKTLNQILTFSPSFPKLPLEGAINAVRTIKQEGYPLGVVTGSPKADIDLDFDERTVTPAMFDYFQTSDATMFHKPDPRVFEPTLQWLNDIRVEAADTLFIGDTLNDYWAARGAGFMFLGVETTSVDMSTFYNIGALSIRSLGDIIKST